MTDKYYSKEQLTAGEAQRKAQEIAFGPIVFQVSRIMIRRGIFQFLSDNEGHTLEEISQHAALSRYATQILLESSLTAGTILISEDKYRLSKTGWFLLNDKMAE